MKKKELKATKPALKNSQKGNSAVRKKAIEEIPDGRENNGGARKGAGRKPKPFETQQIHIDFPVDILKGFEASPINNKTGFVVYIAAKELLTHANIRSNAKLRNAIKKFTIDPKF